MKSSLYRKFGRMRPGTIVLFMLSLGLFFAGSANAQMLKAGTGKSNITADCGDVHDSLYVKALVLKSKKTNLAIITLDVVAIGRIGDVPDDYFENVKRRLKEEFNLTSKAIPSLRIRFCNKLANSLAVQFLSGVGTWDSFSRTSRALSASSSVGAPKISTANRVKSSLPMAANMFLVMPSSRLFSR